MSTMTQELSAEQKRILLKKLLQQKAQERTYPLSAEQQRFWFLDQLDPGNSAYNVVYAVRLAGRLDKAALERSVNEIVRRHAILRTTFVAHKGQTVQKIAPHQAFQLTVEVLPPLAALEREAAVQSIAREEAGWNFDLSQGPLYRMRLVQVQADEHVGFVTMHHTVADGVSMDLFVRELGMLYAAYAANQPSPLPDLTWQYVDFVNWQREPLEQTKLQQPLNYWKNKLAGELPVLQLPTDFPRPPFRTAQGSTYYLDLPAASSDALKSLAQQTGCTLFVTLLAAFKTLLYRISGQADLLVGTPVSGRHLPQTNQLIGLFLNTVVLRTTGVGNLPFRQWLAQVRETTLEALAHQELPFAQLVDEVQPERDPSRSPLFQVMFVARPPRRKAQQVAGLTFQALETDSGASLVDLSLMYWETEAGLRLAFEYSTELFTHETISRLAAHFSTLLQGIIADPDQALAELPLLTAAARHHLLTDWNDTARPYDHTACIHTLFERQTAQTPAAAALMAGGEILTYAQLNDRADRLAAHLQRLGAGRESLVGVCLHRSADLVIALLAILKAGGAYVPLDPNYPTGRIAMMLADSQTAVLLTQTDLLDSLPPFAGHIVCLDQVQLPAHDAPRPLALATANSLAYLIYTSGSTGRPKGVSITHRNAVAMLQWAGELFSAAELAGTLAVTSICFDLSVYELFLPLAQGGTVILAQDALHLLTLPQRHQVTLINTVPSAMAELVRARAIPESVQTINLAGEPLKRVLVDQIYATTNVARIYNLYGPSEDTTYSTGVLVPPAQESEPTIGRSIHNTQAYVLDERLEPVPVGVAGELYLGGDGVTRGYWQRPRLTAERYVPDPFSNQSGARLYRTGDRVKYLPNRELVFLGRIDHQIKLRGYRIELGEIEAVLSQHPNIGLHVVLARQDVPGDTHLVAYFVPQQPPAPGGDALRDHLRASLPDYMLPSHFVALAEMPLTPNGKINRSALPAPDTARPELAAAFEPPRTETETAMAVIWADILQLPQVGVHDTFFDLGGHSLKATQVISRIRDTFNVDLPLRQLFAAPTVAGLSHLVERAWGHAAAATPILAPILPSPRSGDLPLSFAQQRLWFLAQLEPNSPFYNIPAAMRIRGDFSVAVFQTALEKVIARHETLRTGFSEVKGQPVQHIAAAASIIIPVTDLRHLPDAERETGVQHRIMAEAQRPFDLSQPPLLRASLLAIADEEYVLLVTIHHIIADGWSINLLIREVALAYQAEKSGQAVHVPPLPVQYADFAVWQREWLQGDVLAEQLGYWQAQLQGAPPMLELPTERPRPAIQTYPGDTITITVPDAVRTRLVAISRTANATLFMTLLAAFNTLLYRYTGQEDMVIGSPIANRNRSEIENLIGFFVNTLALRTDLSGNPSFYQLLDRVRQMTLEAYAHQDLPFEKLVEALPVSRDLSRTPLFQVLFTLQNNPDVPRLTMPGLQFEPLASDSQTAKFDLSLELRETASGLDCHFNYNTDLFDRETIVRLSQHFQTLLANIATGPDTRLSELTYLTPDERPQLLYGWNQTQLDYPHEATIHGLFERQVKQTPTAAALLTEHQSLTYCQLDEQANHLAAHLQTLGVQPGQFVGVCLSRSVQMVVALLATLKTGAAYVPLDPGYPAERIAFMLADSQAAVLLTQTERLDSLPPFAGHIVCLDTEQLSDHGSPQPLALSTTQALAYLIYTSGSTGRPKGVAITHRNAVAMISWAATWFSAQELAGTLAVTSICFDLSVYELFLPLAQGGTVILAQDALHLLTHPYREQVTLINTVPSAAAALIRLNGIPDSVCTINLAGEPLKRVLVDQLYTRSRVEKVYNLYGPSEDTTYSTGVLVPRDEDSEPTIGWPIHNTQAYVLDGWREPVPVGVPGELYLGGDGVSQGYLNRPGLTAERYVPDPFSGQTGARLYRTGDLVKYRPNGEMIFIGRADHQIKLRGYRIELGEIEAALSRHPNVGLHVVITREDVPGNWQLVAYLVARHDPSPTPDELRRHIQRTLPDYMVPDHFVILDEMPLTPNGKINRRALPVLEHRQLSVQFVAPRTETEATLAGIWQDILHIKPISIDDNFFQIGGHSLTATQVMAYLRETFTIELPLRQLFERPTIAELAKLIDQNRDNSISLYPRSPATILPHPRSNTLPLSFAQQRLWFLDQLEPNSPFYNIPVAFELTGSLDVAALQDALEGMMHRHESLRTTFAAADGQPVQVIHPTLDVPLPRFDWRSLPEGEQKTKLEIALRAEAQHSFDLEQGPLWRGAVFQLADDRQILLVNMHHIISDGWSLGIFIREMVALYAGRADQLPPHSIQYADFAAWQREWLSGEVLATQIDYWRKKLSGAPAALNLPTDRPRPPVQTYRGATHRFTLPVDLADQLHQLSRQEGVTMFMTLLAALQVLFYRTSGQDDMVIGTPIANRTRRETEGLIGFFVNTLALRGQLAADMSFLTLLNQVRETTLAAYAHQDLPFERLIEALQLARDLSRTPLFQVAFSWQNMPLVPPITTSTLSLTPLDMETGIAKFDLTLTMRPTDSGIAASLEYNSDLFEAATITRMSEHLLSLLAAVAAAPEQAIGRLNYLQATERQQLIHTWNATEVIYDAPGTTLQALFEAQVARTPEATAVIFGSEQLTYRELNSRANQLARALRRQGIGHDELVGVCMHRSLEMVVALYGIIKAGAAYVPLDPTYPPERLAFMLADAAVPVLLTQADLVAGLPEHAAAIICLDRDWPLIIDESDANLDLTLTGQNLAYMIYTSGSTGRPKGAMNNHAAIRNRLLWMQAEYHLDQKDRVLQKTPYSFDVSVWEFFWPLITGAALVVAKPEGHKDNHYLVDTIIEQGITTLHFVPSMLQLFVETVGIECCTSLKRVICSGEALPYDLQQRFFTRLPAAALHNLYGPTEAAIDVTYWACWRDDVRQLVPIGRPIANTQIYVLDNQLNPVPIGVTGELHIGGINLARGYWQRPALTVEKFIPDPFSAEPGARLYKTGDAVRFLADGAIDYIGRIDFQVKLRGFRIELGEIESTLARHPAVQEAVVMVREVADDSRLVAYVVPDQQHAAALRRLVRWENSGEISAYEQAELPTGHTLLHQNANEVTFVYEEIFTQQTYLKHGIALSPGACIFDVGANIGLFALFAATAAPQATIYAFEPLPPIFDLLERNCALAGLDVHLYPCGLAAEQGEATFTYYPHASIVSGRFADATEEQAVVKSFLQRQQATQSELTDTIIDELLAERMTSANFTCRLRPLSDIIAETGVTTIDLLKIDVEKSEAGVLAGISEADWPKIRQIVVEVHDLDDRLGTMVGLLRDKGFAVTVAVETALQQSGLYNVYAVRPDAAASPPPPTTTRIEPAATWHSRGRVVESLRHTLQQKLPDYMIPTSFVFLEAMPLTPSGKVERRALPEPTSQYRRAATYVAPRDEVEAQLVTIWETVLGISPVGVTDNFFKLGGHSLLAVQVVARIEKILGRRLPLALLFQKPTVEQFAALWQRPETEDVPLPLVKLREGTGQPLFLVHPGGGHVAGYPALVEHLEQGRPVYGLQAPGLDDAAAPLTDLVALASHYVAAIRAWQPDGPYWLGGLSLGGVIALEMGQQLQANGEEVALLLLFDTRPRPASPQDKPLSDELLLWFSFAQELGIAWQDAVPLLVGVDDPLRPLFDKISGDVPGLDYAYFERLYTVFQANFTAWQHYELRPYSGETVLFIAQAKHPEERFVEADYGWYTLLSDNLKTVAVPGDHYSMMREPQVRTLARQVDAIIAAISTSH